MTIEALKLALEAYIKAGIGNSTDFVLQGKAYDLAVEALAQSEQEPVAHTAIFHCPNCEYPHRQVTHITGVAQPPWSPQRKRLTHEQRLDVMEKFAPHQNKWAAISIMIDLVEDAIEAAHGIKENT